jgi:hypothetical protein
MTVLARALVSWLLTLGFALLVAMGASCLAFGNFVVAWQSFTAQGFEQLPLRRVPLLGWWAEGFGAGEAPIAALYALVLTVAMNLAIMAAAKVSGRTLQLFFDRRQALRSTDAVVQATAPAYLDQTVRFGVYAAFLLVASVFIVGYDVAQFRFRYENLFSQATDPGDVLTWAPDAVARLGGFVAGFIRTATWGYVGCVIALAIALEYALTRVTENWHNLHNALAEAVNPDTQEHYRDLDDRPPVETRPSTSTGDTETEFAQTTAPDPNDRAPTQAAPVTVTDSVSVPPPPPVDPPPSAVPREETLVDVYVGPGRVESHRLAEVQTDAARFVRDGSGRAWFLRAYWEALTGGPAPEGVGR